MLEIPNIHLLGVTVESKPPGTAQAHALKTAGYGTRAPGMAQFFLGGRCANRRVWHKSAGCGTSIAGYGTSTAGYAYFGTRGYTPCSIGHNLQLVR